MSNKILSLEIKNYRSCRGNETDCWSGTLHLNYRPVAQLDCDGNGGGVSIFFADRHNSTAEAILQEYCKSLPLVQSGYEGIEPYPYDLEILVEDIVERMAVTKKVKRDMKTSICVIDDEVTVKGSYARIKMQSHWLTNPATLKQATEHIMAKECANKHPVFAHDDLEAFIDRLTGNKAHPRS